MKSLHSIEVKKPLDYKLQAIFSEGAYSTIDHPVERFYYNSRLRKMAIALAVFEVLLRPHTVITNSLTIERRRYHGRYIQGWKMSMAVIRNGISLGLAQTIDMPVRTNFYRAWRFDAANMR